MGLEEGGKEASPEEGVSGWEGPEDSSFHLQLGQLAFPSWSLGVYSFTDPWTWLADPRG